MKLAYVWILAAFMAPLVFAAMPSASESVNAKGSSPIFGVTIPAGYRQWEMIAPSHQTGSFNELRAIVGNPLAMTAYRKETLPFPDGAILVKLAWKRVPSNEFKGAFVPGAATTVQIMVKDLKNMLPQAAGDSADLSTANLRTRRSTKHVSAVMRLT